MANVNYDKLTIKIGVDSGNANKSINKLSSNLQKLDDVATNLHKENIAEARELLQGIANIDFTNVAEGLRSVVNAFKAFQNKSFLRNFNNAVNSSPLEKGTYTTAEMSGLGEVLEGLRFPPISTDFVSYLSEAERQMGALRNTINGTTIDLSALTEQYAQFGSTDIQGFIDFLNGLGGASRQIDGLTLSLKELHDVINANNSSFETFVSTKLQQLGLNTKQIKAVLSSANFEKGTFNAEELDNVRSVLHQIGVEGWKAEEIISRLKTEVQEKGTDNNWIGKSVFQFKNILKYRIIRKVIQEIFKALQEGFQHILAFDTSLQDSYNEIQNSLHYMKDAFGAMMSPLIQILTPVLVLVIDLVAKLANVLAEMFAKLNGADGYAKAIKGAEDYASALKKTQGIGIDELNVLKPEDEGNFEWVELEKTGRGLADAFNDLAVILNPILDIILAIFEALEPSFEMLAHSANVLVAMVEVVVGVLTGNFDLIDKAWKKLWIGCVNFYISIANTIINIFRGVLVVIQEVINAVVNFMDKYLFFGGLSHLGWKGMDISSWVKNISYQSYATGGFPEDGLFLANHNELVGQFSNGQTAVANNEQITEGIYQAVLQAMRESGGSGDVVINLDGYEMARVITKRQNNSGSRVIFGGNINYGK